MKQNKETLKKHFETGDKPTQQQYADLIDSYVDCKQPEGEANRRFVINDTGEVSVASEKIAPMYTLSDIVANKLSFLKDGEVVKEIDLTTYVDDTNLARLVSGTVDENGLATFTRDDNSTFTLDLSSLKEAVPKYQAGTNISIDSTDPQNPIINANGGNGGVITDLSYNSTTRTIGSSAGEGTVLPLANSINAGLMKADFYEEGTFKPTFSDNGGGATYTYSGPRRGTYVRVGNTVTFNIEFGHVYTTGTPTGFLFVLGLPFPLGSQPLSNTNQGFSAVNVSDFTNTDLINIRSVKGNIRTLSSSPTIVFHVSTDSSVTQTLATSTTLNNSSVIVSGTYITNVYTS